MICLQKSCSFFFSLEELIICLAFSKSCRLTLFTISQFLNDSRLDHAMSLFSNFISSSVRCTGTYKYFCFENTLLNTLLPQDMNYHFSRVSFSCLLIKLPCILEKDRGVVSRCFLYHLITKTSHLFASYSQQENWI